MGGTIYCHSTTFQQTHCVSSQTHEGGTEAILSLPEVKDRKRGCFGSSPHPVAVANKGLQRFPTKNVMILVVTVTGVDPKDVIQPFCGCSDVLFLEGQGTVR